jgi:hypothetical protein
MRGPRGSLLKNTDRNHPSNIPHFSNVQLPTMSRKRNRDDEQKVSSKKKTRTPLSTAEVLLTNEKYLGLDEKFTNSIHRWTDHTVVIKARQGSGKTRFVLDAIIKLLTPESKFIFLAPNNATINELQQTLRTNPRLPPGTKIAYHSDLTREHFNDWQILFSHPRSVHRFDIRKCDLFIVDELSASNHQLLSWNELTPSVKDSIDNSRRAQSHLLQNAKRIVLLGAQITDLDLNVFCEVLSIPQLSKPILLYDSGLRPPQTIVNLKSTEERFLFQLWQMYLAGESFSVSVGTARKASMLYDWIERKIQKLLEKYPLTLIAGQKPNIKQCLIWTAKHIQKNFTVAPSDLTAYTTKHKTRIIISTCALSPGVSIDQPAGRWHQRCLYLCAQTPSSLAIQAQCVNRLRNPTNLDIFTFIEKRNGKRKSVDVIAQIKTKAPSAIVKSICPQTGRVTDTLKKNYSTQLRSELIRERNIRSRRKLAAKFASHLDNGTVRIDDDMNLYPKCKIWQDIQSDYEKSNAYQYLSFDEVEREEARMYTTQRVTTPKNILHIKQIHRIAKTIPLSLVHPKFREANTSLSAEAFEILLLRPKALAAFTLFTHSTPQGFNASLRTRIIAFNEANPLSKDMPLHLRIFPIEIGFLLTRLLLDIPLLRNALTAESEDFLRPDMDSTHFNYLEGRFESLFAFIQFHSSPIRMLFSKARKNAFDDMIAGGEEQLISSRKSLIALMRIALGQAGVGFSARYAGVDSLKKYQTRVIQPWSTLGIGMEELTDAIKSPQKLKDIQSITECESCQTGEPTLCIRQRGRWVCIASQSFKKSPCRDLYCPLDITLNKIDLVEAKLTPADQILHVLGFSGGLESTLQLSKQTIESTFDDSAVLRLSALKNLDSVFGTSLELQTDKKSKVSKLVRDANTILQSSDYKLVRRKKQVNGTRLWLYWLVSK